MYIIETSYKKVGEVAFSADGHLAALSAGFPWECEVWSLPLQAEPDWNDVVDESFAFGLAFDPRTGHVLHGDAKDGLIASDPEEGRYGWEIPGGPLRAFAISASGDRLVCGCEAWDGRTPKHNIAAQIVGFKRAGKKSDWTHAAIFEGDGFVFSDLAFFANGKRFASIEWSSRKQGRERTQGDVPTLRVHDSQSLGEVDAISFQRPANGLAVCGERVVVRGEKSIRVWNGDDLAVDFVEVKTGRTPLGAIAPDPQGRFVLTAVGSTATMWDSSRWTAGKTYDWASGKITCLAVSPDGAIIAAGTATGKVVVWDTQ